MSRTIELCLDVSKIPLIQLSNMCNIYGLELDCSDMTVKLLEVKCTK